jgi:glucan biosynthesis protein C
VTHGPVRQAVKATPVGDSQQSYAVYVIQIPVIVFVAYALRQIDLDALPKFALVSAVVLPACFLAAYLLRRMPLAPRVF